VNSKRSKAKRKERVQKDARAVQIGEERKRKREEKRKEKEKERKNKEIGNCLPHTRYAPSTSPGVYYIIHMEQYK
jgi:hypothetical protein